MEHVFHEKVLLPQSLFHGQRNASMIVLGDVIGTGSFATVRKGSLIRPSRPIHHRLVESTTITSSRPKRDNNTIFAIKIIQKDRPELTGDISNSFIMREITILRQCAHLPFVAKFFFTVETSSIQYIVLEYCPRGDLYSLLNTTGVSYLESKLYLAQIASVLTQLHGLNIVHHDIKPENICLDQNGNIKLVDFGTAHLLDQSNYNHESGRRETTCSSGTLPYTAPEIFYRLPHAFEVDWWSFGVITYELLCGSLPYAIEGTIEEQCASVCCATKDFHRNEYIVPGSCEESFLSLFLVKNRKERFGYADIRLTCLKTHEFFHEINWDMLDATGNPKQ